MKTDKANVGEILQKIYDSEIHFSIGWMWDGGVDYKIGADLSYLKGTTESNGNDKIESAVNEIADEVAKQYPESEFAQWWEWWVCKYCGENTAPKCRKCTNASGKDVSDFL